MSEASPPVAGEASERDRVAQLIASSSAELRLDLGGARVVTEAATGAFASTAVLAAGAGAEVHALTRDSSYGTADDATGAVRALAEEAGAPTHAISFHLERETLPTGVDVITNSGFVRPVDADLLALLGPRGAVSLMYEAWEARASDVDLEECRRVGVPVGGVNEEFGSLRIFSSCGALAVKLLLEAGLEVAGNRILLVSGDRFGDVIEPVLAGAGAVVTRLSSGAEITAELAAPADAILVADYEAQKPVVTAGHPGLRVVQLVGPNDIEALERLGVSVYPRRQLEPHQMSVTLAHLGPRPAVYLQAAGLKVGELLWRRRSGEATPREYEGLAQEVVP